MSTLTHDAAETEIVPPLASDQQGLPCAAALILLGKPAAGHGSFTLKTPVGLLEAHWRGIAFEATNEEFGLGLSDPISPGFYDLLYVRYQKEHGDPPEIAAGFGGHALVRFTFNGQPLTLQDERFILDPFWDDGSEVGDTIVAFPGPRRSCNGTWLALAAMSQDLPGWGEELEISSRCKFSWGEGQREGTWALRLHVEYLSYRDRMPCLQDQIFTFDVGASSYSFAHRFAPIWRREDD